MQNQGGKMPPVPSRPVRSGTAILGRYNEHIQHAHEDHAHQDRLDPHGAGPIGAHFHHVADELHDNLDERRAAALQHAKDRGLATPAMIEHITAMPGVNPYAVSELPLEIQTGFRKKMLTLLFLQLLFSVAVAFFLRYVPAITTVLETVFPPQGIASLALLICVMLGLPIMSCIKDKHPWNLLFTFFWSILLGMFLAASDLPGAYARAHAFLMIMLLLTGGIFFLIFFAQIKVRDIEGNPKLIGFSLAGTCSWITTVIVASIVFTQTRSQIDWQEVPPAPIFATATVVSTIVYTWFCYESYKLCCKMQPDEYMKGVIYFYTDMFYVCACCALLACLGGGGGGNGGGAPPKADEER